MQLIAYETPVRNVLFVIKNCCYLFVRQQAGDNSAIPNLVWALSLSQLGLLQFFLQSMSRNHRNIEIMCQTVVEKNKTVLLTKEIFHCLWDPYLLPLLSACLWLCVICWYILCIFTAQSKHFWTILSTYSREAKLWNLFVTSKFTSVNQKPVGGCHMRNTYVELNRNYLYPSLWMVMVNYENCYNI